MNRFARGFFALTFSLTVAAPAFAGIADSPLPVLQAGVSTLHLYSVPGVISDFGTNLGTFFLCTSTSSSTQQVAVEVFGPAAVRQLTLQRRSAYRRDPLLASERLVGRLLIKT